MRLYIAQKGQDLKAFAQPTPDGSSPGAEPAPFVDITTRVGGTFALSQSGLIPLIRQGAPNHRQLEMEVKREAVDSTLTSLEGYRIKSPIIWPSKVLCVGQNYVDHCLEQGIEPPRAPIFFTKFPQCIIGDGEAIAYPTELTEKLDYEVELAVVIGHQMCEVEPDEALAGIFGYTVVNDITARDIQKGDGQWTRGKGGDTFCPVGPCIAMAGSAIKDPQNLNLSSWVNGELRQNSNTKQMVFGVAELVSRASRFITLHPGDIIITGTPPGVGMWREPSGLLQPGDKVRVEVEGIGSIENPVITKADWLQRTRR